MNYYNELFEFNFSFKFTHSSEWLTEGFNTAGSIEFCPFFIEINFIA